MEDMAARDTEPGAGKPFRRVVGKLLLVVAGMGAVALVVFVAQPMLTAPAPEPPPMAPEEIVAEVLSEPPAEDYVEPVLTEDVQSEQVPTMPTPLMAVRHGVEELPVVFTAAEEATAGEDSGSAADLPPVLSAEETEPAVSNPVPEDDDGSAPAADEAEDAGQQALAVAVVDTRLIPDAVIEGSGSGNWGRMALPPPEATREVQALLQSLGYEPGPADGIWGDMTARAWKSFARDASNREAKEQLAQVTPMAPGPADVPTRPEEPAAPSGGTGVEAANGSGRAGPPDAGLPHASLPLYGTTGESVRMRVPGNLRGVMGYRLPLVSRQEVPDQIVSGVLIPAHTTFVILRGGEWELTGLDPHEVERLEGERAGRQPEALGPKTHPEPQRRGWNPLRLFRRQPASVDAK